MNRPPQLSTRRDTPVPYSTLLRSKGSALARRAGSFARLRRGQPQGGGRRGWCRHQQSKAGSDSENPAAEPAGAFEHGFSPFFSERLAAGNGPRFFYLEQIRVGWNRRRRSTDPVNLLYPFEVDRIHVVRWNRGAVQSYHHPIEAAPVPAASAPTEHRHRPPT